MNFLHVFIISLLLSGSRISAMFATVGMLARTVTVSGALRGAVSINAQKYHRDYQPDDVLRAKRDFEHKKKQSEKSRAQRVQDNDIYIPIPLPIAYPYKDSSRIVVPESEMHDDTDLSGD